jgi:CRP/FNR family cyclic AMP-dependent transcriptional regulator
VVVIQRAQLTRVSRVTFEQALLAQSSLALLLVQRLALRVRTLTRTVAHLVSVDAYGRLAGLVDALAVTQGGQRIVPGPISQARIAEQLGTSRPMVHRLLHDLLLGGYIEITRERIVLLKKLPPRW